MPEPIPLIVTGKPEFAAYIIERCGLPADVEIRSTVAEDDIRGRHVYGMLPPHLGQHAARISTLAIKAPKWIRPKGMTLDEMRRYGAEICTYQIVVLSDQPAPRR